MSNLNWQQAWEDAQPRLAQLRDFINPHTSPHPSLVRVGQLDAELLDHDLVHVLQDPLNKALTSINSSLKAHFEPELRLLIQLTLYKLSIWNAGASYGAQLQNLRYSVPSSAPHSLSPSGLPRVTLLIHSALTLLLPYAHTRIRTHALSHSWPDTPSSDSRRKAWNILTTLESFHSLLSLLSFVSFLQDGRYRTIADRLLGMQLSPSSGLLKRDVSYEFMNRQMVWHAFTEFLLFLLPLISARAIRRRINRLASHVLSLTSPIPPKTCHTRKRGKYYALSLDQCAICAENASFGLNMADSANVFTLYTDASTHAEPQSTSANDDDQPPQYPITMPYVTPCGHVYCYHCLAERLVRAADDGVGKEDWWECLRCTEGVGSASRLELDSLDGEDTVSS